MLDTPNLSGSYNGFGSTSNGSLLSNLNSSNLALSGSVSGLTDPLQQGSRFTSSSSLSTARQDRSDLDWMFDMGNNLGAARNLGAINGIYTSDGRVQSHDPSDFYRVDLAANSNLNITLTKGLVSDTGSNADVRVIRDFNGNGRVDTGEVIASSTRGSNLDEAINLSGLAMGSYFVQVYQHTGSPYYKLRVSGDKPNNLLSSETSVGNLSGTRVFSNSVGSTDTSDTYSFNLSSTRSLNMTLSGLSNDADIRLIRDANGNGIMDSTDVIQSSTRGGANAEWISTTLTAGNYFVQVSQYIGDTNYNFTISTGDWYSNNLSDAGLIGQARTFGQDGSLSRTDMMSLMRETRDYSTIDSTEVTDLRRIVSSLGYMMPDSVRVLSSKVVNSDPANARSGIGNLSAGSSATQMDSLINKWFLGNDRPDAAGTYRFISGSLFQNGISQTDIDQNALGDCYLMASLASTAQRSPSTISNMFIDNGDGTFTVRLYPHGNGVADYVTVDRWLPTDASGNAIYAGWGGGRFSSTGNELWAALAEKAYAQMNESGRLGQEVIANSYASIDGGNSSAALRHVTARLIESHGIVRTSTIFGIPLLAAANANLVAAVNSGQMVILNTFDDLSIGSRFTEDHSYAVTGYNLATRRFSLYNPHGTNVTEVNWNEIAANFDWWDATVPGLAQVSVG